mmetsp:Transcript_91736/g.285944  ORF Transcript_91736/g.285944 Transcript_91736/m.285944 type:complete len:235 (-) Transcript_91736:61-765(-)
MFAASPEPCASIQAVFAISGWWCQPWWPWPWWWWPWPWRWWKPAPHSRWHARSPGTHSLWHSMCFHRPMHLSAMRRSGLGHCLWQRKSPALQALWHSKAVVSLACIRGHCGCGHLAWQSMSCQQDLWQPMMGFISSHFFSRCAHGFGHRSWHSWSPLHFTWHSLTILLISCLWRSCSKSSSSAWPAVSVLHLAAIARRTRRTDPFLNAIWPPSPTRPKTDNSNTTILAACMAGA